MSSDQSWACKQIPNGQNPIVVCEREALRDEIVRLRAEVERLTNGNNVMGLLWNAERALADQLAEAVKGLHHAAIIGVYRPTEELAVSTAALAAHEAARKEEQ